VEGLPPRQQDLIRMFYGENLSADKIATSWDRTVHAVYKALKVMRKSLLECVERRLAAEGLAQE
jgi:RNA polymerase sigma-70 factor (ECF subfamily)